MALSGLTKHGRTKIVWGIYTFSAPQISQPFVLLQMLSDLNMASRVHLDSYPWKTEFWCQLVSWLLTEYFPALGAQLVATLPRVTRPCDNCTCTCLIYFVMNYAGKNKSLSVHLHGTFSGYMQISLSNSSDSCYVVMAYFIYCSPWIWNERVKHR